ncbi:MAG: bifunctional adenosylcobinamide kinase/adenosylcobinamide-phosphate guanylyltransferase [Spirochaetes bacterium]|nr:bifunctional adenosylcobinamide kinase/adenosylcobinamide-phosphate guanylyltransferase [Spirochaetota bacterium]
MGKLIFITGGARSGKSAFAEELLKKQDSVVYVATSIAFDDEMRDRIAKHKSMRNPAWSTVEAYKDLDIVLEKSVNETKYILVDCLTIMISNLMTLENTIDWDTVDIDTVNNVEKRVQAEIDQLLSFARSFAGEIIIVSNELGMGVVPPAPLGRYYRDIAGRINQIVADAADSVYFVVSGIPLKIKG